MRVVFGEYKGGVVSRIKAGLCAAECDSRQVDYVELTPREYEQLSKQLGYAPVTFEGVPVRIAETHYIEG